MRFPSVTGHNLQREALDLPDDFGGEHNLVLIAFQRWQQDEVDSWLPFATRLGEAHPGLHTYELPTMEQRGALARTMIDEGMRAGIPDPAARDRTITLYLDKVAFRQALQLPHEDHIAVMLLDREGDVLWRAEGGFTPEVGDSLASAVQAAQPDGSQ